MNISGCYSEQNFQTMAVLIFYQEQYHSDVTWNEYGKLLMLQLQIHQS